MQDEFIWLLKGKARFTFSKLVSVKKALAIGVIKAKNSEAFFLQKIMEKYQKMKNLK